jgi:hypothetical protein
MRAGANCSQPPRPVAVTSNSPPHKHLLDRGIFYANQGSHVEKFEGDIHIQIML